MSTDQFPKLSISVVSYNQKKYLEECLESILKQRLPFAYEIVIGDDASTDGTQEYLLSLKKRYPSIIVPILREKNLGLAGNLFETTRVCKGEYIAHIDGDDLMLPSKLLTQVNFLDNNPDYAIICHGVQYIDQFGKFIKHQKNDLNETSSFNDLLLKNKIVHSSKMYRRSSIKEYFYLLPYSNMVPDWYINLCNAHIGKIKFIPDILGSYRILNSSATRKTKSFRLTKSKIEVLETAQQHIPNIDTKQVKKSKNHIYNHEAHKNMKKKLFLRAFYFLHLSLKERISLKALLLFIKLNLISFINR